MRNLSLLAASLMLGVSACGSATPPDDTSDGSGGSGAGTGGQVATGAGGSVARSGGAGGRTSTGGAPGQGGSTTGSGGAGGQVVGSVDAASSGGAGGAPDASTRSDTAGSGSTGGTCEGAKKCFDFEDQTAGKPPSSPDFKVETHGGSITTDTTKFYSGKQSILIKSTKGGDYPGNNLIFSGIEALLPENDLHGRVMVWMNQTPGGAHWDSILGSAAGGANPTYIVGGMYKKFMSVYHPGDCSVDSATPFPTATWACIQWEFKGTKDGKHLHKMMLNGEVVDKGIQDANQGYPPKDWKAPTFSQLKVGFRSFGAPVGVDMWIDDLAFGDKPIPCPPKM